jgi:anti-sigma factor ChrR (cupin superfamily)
MSTELVNADFNQRVVIDTTQLAWVPSPLPGVERRLLDRIGGEVARATSVVRYAPRSVFSAHEHALGEEFLVLEGVFSDESGDFPAGTYVRNPPGSRHAPSSAPGCVIFVKLRQMPVDERERVVVNTAGASWSSGERAGHRFLLLYVARAGGERVTLERLEPGASLAEQLCTDGEEIFVLTGELRDAQGTYRAGTWIRNPAGYRRALRSDRGCTFWAKRGHLRGLTSAS